MTEREKQLKERDVRKNAPELNPLTFLKDYVDSNFPQTAALQSNLQKQLGIYPQIHTNGVDYNKKPMQGISFDNPKGG